ncbi:LysR substrate-binding domain-containing protein [Streptomyces sp. NPDC096354]|uniref:LysR substrate-binding domain-containing protein n=1 Tax=Streptomyces sp. NPDC096354 TaxID=3366088 RepID=UPI003829FE9B
MTETVTSMRLGCLSTVREPNLLDGRLKLRHLRYSVAIAERGSLVAAADQLHITQPVVTRGLRELESILGVELFERGPRGMTPTVCGDAFVDHARAVLTELRRAGQHVAEIAGHTGKVTIGTFLAGANVLLPHAVAQLKRAQPNVTVVIHHGNPEALHHALLEGSLDLIVGALQPIHNLRLRQYPLYREPIRVVARTQHPAHALDNPTLADLVDDLWSLPLADSPLRQQLEQQFLRYGLPAPSNRVECHSFLSVRAIALEIDTLIALPQLVMQTEPGLAALPLALDIVESVGVTLAAETPPTPAMRLMLHHLQLVADDIQRSLESS